MIDYNPERDKWQSRCMDVSARLVRIVDVLTRKAMLPPPEDQAGTFVCPYCYNDTPHSALSHDQVADDFERAAADTGGVLSERQREFLRFVAKQCREHGERR